MLPIGKMKYPVDPVVGVGEWVVNSSGRKAKDTRKNEVCRRWNPLNVDQWLLQEGFRARPTRDSIILLADDIFCDEPMSVFAIMSIVALTLKIALDSANVS